MIMNKKLILTQFMQYMNDNWWYVQKGLWENNEGECRNYEEIINIYLEQVG